MKYIKNGIIYNEVKFITEGDMNVVNPTHEQIINAGYETYIEPIPTPEQLLEGFRQNKIYEIDAYDKSAAVNVFYLGEVPMWLDKETRTGLKLRFESEETIGRTTTTLWYDNICYTLPIDDAKLMLVQLEVYASDCFDVTAQHKSNIYGLNIREEIETYDYTVGYPEKLHF